VIHCVIFILWEHITTDQHITNPSRAVTKTETYRFLKRHLQRYNLTNK